MFKMLKNVENVEIAEIGRLRNLESFGVKFGVAGFFIGFSGVLNSFAIKSYQIYNNPTVIKVL